jgi:hypothetical protein
MSSQVAQGPPQFVHHGHLPLLFSWKLLRLTPGSFICNTVRQPECTTTALEQGYTFSNSKKVLQEAKEQT